MANIPRLVLAGRLVHLAREMIYSDNNSLPEPLRALDELIRNNLTEDLLTEHYRTKKAPDSDPTEGHCANAAGAFWYLAGGKEAGWGMYRLSSKDWDVLPEGETHWWAQHSSGVIADPTRTQFKDKVPYDQGHRGFPPTRGLDDQGRPLPRAGARIIMQRILETRAGKKAVKNALNWSQKNK